MTNSEKQKIIVEINDAMVKVEEAKTSVKGLIPSRETSSAITKLDCARHWLRDLKESVEQFPVEN